MECQLFYLLVSAIAIVSVNGDIGGIRTCKRTDPHISKCIEGIILEIRGNLTRGIPHLDVPPIDPLSMRKLTLNLGPGLNAEGRDLLLRGGSNFELRNLVADLPGDSYSFDIGIPEINARGTYVIDANIAGIPFKGRGPITMTGKTITGRGTLHGKKVVRKGKTMYWFPSMDLKVQLGDYVINLENLFEVDPAIGEVTNKLLNEEKKEVLASLIPGLEKSLIEHILLIANNICKHFTYEELFPET